MPIKALLEHSLQLRYGWVIVGSFAGIFVDHGHMIHDKVEQILDVCGALRMIVQSIHPLSDAGNQL